MRHPLPYAFARTAQLLLEDDGHQLVLWHGPHPDAGALSEVLRKHPVQQLLPLDAPALAQRISAVYSHSESSAADIRSVFNWPPIRQISDIAHRYAHTAWVTI